jgi:phosphatidylcholine synthase
MIVLAAIRGQTADALWLSAAAVVIDSTDGTLARRFHVRTTLPWFDGALLDNIVDYLTYVFAPIVLLYQGNYLPAGPAGLLLAVLPLLASAYQFCRVDAKTDDHFFLGFPSYWNIVALYAIIGHTDPTMLGAVLLICSALVFVPIRYIYPTRTVALMPLTLGLGTLWGIAVLILLLQLPHPDPWLVNLSYLYIVYYVAASLYLNRIPSPVQEQPELTS